MATKINPDFYGTENTFVTLTATPQVKRCASNVGQLLTSGKYTGGSYDPTASPWGIGKSSISSDFFFLASQGASWKIFSYTNPKKNTPLWLYYNPVYVLGGNDPSGVEGSSATSSFFSRAAYKNRIDPAVNISDNTILSSLDVDTNARIDIPSSSGQYPVTYANYQNLRLAIVRVWVKPTNSNSIVRTDMSAIKNGNVSVDKLIRFEFGLFDTSGNGAGVQFSVGGGEIDIPEVFKTCYYGDTYKKWVRPWRRIGAIGYWLYNTSDLSISYYTFNSSEASFTSYWETLSDRDNMTQRADANAWGHMSEAMQAFDDVSYHWEWGISPAADSQFNINPIQTGDAYSSITLRNFAYMVFDDEPDNKNMACFNAILHEVAFLGFPIVISTSDYAENIGSNKVYLPVFDDHMITTGEFLSGSASLDLPNATWGDIFGEEMPEYDPEYDPDTPPDPDEDYGYLNNKPLTYRAYSSNNRVYALTAAQYNQFIKDINSLYLDDPDTGFASFQLDFKGTNPSDYIVGAYGYTFLPAYLDPNQQPEHISIGPVTLPNAEGYRIAPTYIFQARILGEIDLTGAGDFKPFGDFRDFEPYTHIELYIPLCGNIELDPAAVVGHIINIEIVYDIMTGNATACVYRDNQTLIATVAGQLAASLPLTSGRMGDYQNAVKSAENALKQNELKTTTAAASVAIGVGAALLAPETGGLSLAAYGAAMTGGASLMSLANQKNQIEYEIKHKQPSISVCSSANGTVAQNISSMRAVCYVKQCKLLSTYNAATYAHTVGHACVKNTTIGAETTDDSNSLIVCSNADLSGIPATAAEINAIQSLLTGGIYV